VPSYGIYRPLQPDASFYMILEVTTIDNDVITLPKEDPTLKVVGAIESLETKLLNIFEQFPELIKSVPPVVPAIIDNEITVPVPVPVPVPVSVPVPVPVKKEDIKMYWIIAIVLILIAYYLMNSKK
jgi:hypothetical protein